MKELFLFMNDTIGIEIIHSTIYKFISVHASYISVCVCARR